MVEDWLYEDGEDETKGVYIAKLEELKKVDSLHCLLIFLPLVCLLYCTFYELTFIRLQIGDPIEARCKEWTDRGSAVDQLVYCINSFREAALSNDQKFEHIEISEKQKVSQWSCSIS